MGAGHEHFTERSLCSLRRSWRGNGSRSPCLHTPRMFFLPPRDPCPHDLRLWCWDFRFCCSPHRSGFAWWLHPRSLPSRRPRPGTRGNPPVSGWADPSLQWMPRFRIPIISHTIRTEEQPCLIRPRKGYLVQPVVAPAEAPGEQGRKAVAPPPCDTTLRGGSTLDAARVA